LFPSPALLFTLFSLFFILSYFCSFFSKPSPCLHLFLEMPLNQDLENNLDSKDDWEYFALQNLNQCYGENEPEYTLDLIKENNINYARS